MSTERQGSAGRPIQQCLSQPDSRQRRARASTQHSAAREQATHRRLVAGHRLGAAVRLWRRCSTGSIVAAARLSGAGVHRLCRPPRWRRHHGARLHAVGPPLTCGATGKNTLAAPLARTLNRVAFSVEPLSHKVPHADTRCCGRLLARRFSPPSLVAADAAHHAGARVHHPAARCPHPAAAVPLRTHPGGWLAACLGAWRQLQRLPCSSKAPAPPAQPPRHGSRRRSRTWRRRPAPRAGAGACCGSLSARGTVFVRPQQWWLPCLAQFL